LVRAGHDYYTECVKTSTVASQAAYALPSDFFAITRLEWYNSGQSATTMGTKINLITPNERDMRDSVTGDPYHYYFQKNNFILVPVPNRVIELHLEYSPQVADMVNDNDEPDAPLQYHEYIAVLASKKCFLKDGRPLAPIQEDLGRLELELKKIADEREQDGARMVVSTSDGWGY
jgi:hypothetical protein